MRLLILLLFPILSFAQDTTKWKFKLFEPETRRQGFWAKQALIVGAAMYAGFTRHERDVLRDYYEQGYLKVWPNANPQWSNPQISYANKYVDGDRSKGRKKIWNTGINVPVWTTDKFHASTLKVRLCYSISLGGSLTLWKRMPNWKQVAGQVLLVFAADVAGNAISTVLYGY